MNSYFNPNYYENLAAKFTKIESDSTIICNMNNKSSRQITRWERKCWENEEYFSREHPETLGLVDSNMKTLKKLLFFCKVRHNLYFKCWILSRLNHEPRPQKIIIKISKRQYQRCIWNPVKNLRWSFFVKTVNGKNLLTYSRKKGPS